MSAVDSSIVLLPRHTTLVGAGTFATLPMDVSSYGGAQFQVWRGAFRVKSATPPAAFTMYFEESLDTESWSPPPSGTASHVLGASAATFFSYSFRLRWFRVRIDLQGDEPIVTCWAEGLLRGGGGGLWNFQSGGPTGEILGRPGAVAQTKPPGWSWNDWFIHQNEQNLRALGAQPPRVPGQEYGSGMQIWK